MAFPFDANLPAASRAYKWNRLWLIFHRRIPYIGRRKLEQDHSLLEPKYIQHVPVGWYLPISILHSYGIHRPNAYNANNIDIERFVFGEIKSLRLKLFPVLLRWPWEYKTSIPALYGTPPTAGNYRLIICGKCSLIRDEGCKSLHALLRTLLTPCNLRKIPYTSIEKRLIIIPRKRNTKGFELKI